MKIKIEQRGLKKWVKVWRICPHTNTHYESETTSFWSPEIENSVDEEQIIEVCECKAVKDMYGSWEEVRI